MDSWVCDKSEPIWAILDWIMIKIDKPLILAFTTWWSSHQIRVSARRICNCFSKDPTWYLYGWFSLPELLLVFGQSFDGPTLSDGTKSHQTRTLQICKAGNAKICQVAWHTSSPLTSCQHRFLMSFLSENVAKMLIDPWIEWDIVVPSFQTNPVTACVGFPDGCSWPRTDFMYLTILSQSTVEGCPGWTKNISEESWDAFGVYGIWKPLQESETLRPHIIFKQSVRANAKDSPFVAGIIHTAIHHGRASYDVSEILHHSWFCSSGDPKTEAEIIPPCFRVNPKSSLPASPHHNLQLQRLSQIIFHKLEDQHELMWWTKHLAMAGAPQFCGFSFTLMNQFV